MVIKKKEKWIDVGFTLESGNNKNTYMSITDLNEKLMENEK